MIAFIRVNVPYPSVAAVWSDALEIARVAEISVQTVLSDVLER
jgi:hypothetical protein